MSLNTWTRSGSEKAQASQTIRILLKTLQYLAEDVAADPSREESFVKIASSVINDVFTPSDDHSVNEQVSVVFNTIGWKNTQIKFISSDEAEILLGSNRHLDQDIDSEEGLRVLLKTISKGLGSYIFDQPVSVNVELDLRTGPTYRITLYATQKTPSSEDKESKDDTSKLKSPPSRGKKPSQSTTQTSDTGGEISSIDRSIESGSPIETDQIFLPVLSNKLPVNKLHMILKDVLVEFAQSWYGQNPLDQNMGGDVEENVEILSTFLTNQAYNEDKSRVEIGEQVGEYFAQALEQTFEMDQMISPEILDGSAVGSIIRDIKARAFCHLEPGEKCGSEIGGDSRELCDFAMGIWQGCLTQLFDEKKFNFTGFYPAGRRDPYCLMEFDVQEN